MIISKDAIIGNSMDGVSHLIGCRKLCSIAGLGSFLSILINDLGNN
jgi:hypothetical protein